MPAPHLLSLVHPREQSIRFGILQGDRSKAIVAVPRQDPVERPEAEPAIGVVQDDGLFHR
jgi:hypothetical protein